VGLAVKSESDIPGIGTQRVARVKPARRLGSPPPSHQRR